MQGVYEARKEDTREWNASFSNWGKIKNQNLSMKGRVVIWGHEKSEWFYEWFLETRVVWSNVLSSSGWLVLF